MWKLRKLDCGHDASKAIVSNNKIKCVTPVERNLLCGHTRWVLCYIRNSLSENFYQFGAFTNEFPIVKCSELVDIIHTCRRHMYVGECHESFNPGHCGQKCDLPLPCGHYCTYFCHEILHDPIRVSVAGAKQYRGATVSDVASKEFIQEFQCPPCVQVKLEELPCGHEAEVPCSNKEIFIQAYKCDKICSKKIVCGHICLKKCGEPCTPCELVVRKRRPGICPHDVYTGCFDDPCDAICPELVPANPPSTCGHVVLVPCGRGKNRNFKFNRELLQICSAPCTSLLSCGHQCSGVCCQCVQGRFHVRCKAPCDNILPCGHRCRALCSEPCPPCQEECGNICSHRKCDLKCGDPCLDCKAPCDYKCFHGACKRLCFEVCDMEPCDKRCVELIPSCGHACVGFCGEVCPPYCFICDKEKLAEGNLFGDTPEESDRYILLPDCGHVIESHSMDGWMDSRKDQEEITPIFCPLCRTPIRQLKRYAMLMSINRGDILKIMSITNGKEDENNKRRTSLLAALQCHDKTYFQDMRKFLLKFLSEKNQFYKAELDCVDQYLQFVTGSDKTLTEMWLILPKSRWNHLERLYSTLFQHVEGRKVPLTNVEINDFNREFLRIQHAVEIQKRHGRNVSNPVKNFIKLESTMKKFDTIYGHLLHPIPYTDERERQFLENLRIYDQLLNINLNISEEEKMEILQAFGNQTGRWFKCKKGHVYVITECGGAIERGVCYECGETIGGERHRAEDGNVLATEMDGAEQPLYPNAVQLLEFNG